MNKDKIKALAIELYKNEEVAIELANVIFGIRDGDYDEPEKFEIQDDFLITGKDREILYLMANRSHRLLELAAYIGGLKEFVDGEDNWYVSFSGIEDKWDYFSTRHSCSPEKVYMTKAVAKAVCDLLNTGAYILDVE
jgi:hypothetical protein